MVTTPVAILSKVCAQFAGLLGTPGGGTGTGFRGALKTGLTDNANNDKSSEIRDMPILGLDFDWVQGSDKFRSRAVPMKQSFPSKLDQAALPRAHRPIAEPALYAGRRQVS